MKKQIKKFISTANLPIAVLLLGVFVLAPIHSTQGAVGTLINEIIQATDFTNPTTRNFAVDLAAEFPGEYNIGQVLSIYEYLYDNWSYVEDPRGSDYFSPASQTISVGLVGDCDDFAILMAAVIEAVGGKSRIILAYGPEGNHAYTEAFMGTEEDAIDIINELSQLFYHDKTAINYHRQGGYTWLNLDWSATHPGGPFFGPTISEYAVYPNSDYLNPYKYELISGKVVTNLKITDTSSGSVTLNWEPSDISYNLYQLQTNSDCNSERFHKNALKTAVPGSHRPPYTFANLLSNTQYCFCIQSLIPPYTDTEYISVTTNPPIESIPQESIAPKETSYSNKSSEIIVEETHKEPQEQSIEEIDQSQKENQQEEQEIEIQQQATDTIETILEQPEQPEQPKENLTEEPKPKRTFSILASILSAVKDFFVKLFSLFK